MSKKAVHRIKKIVTHKSVSQDFRRQGNAHPSGIRLISARISSYWSSNQSSLAALTSWKIPRSCMRSLTSDTRPRQNSHHHLSPRKRPHRCHHHWGSTPRPHPHEFRPSYARVPQAPHGTLATPRATPLVKV